MKTPRINTVNILHAHLSSFFIITLGCYFSACSNQPDARSSENSRVKPRYQDVELWIKLDNEKAPTFLGMPCLPGNPFPGIATMRNMDDPKFVIERAFAGTTEHGDVWSFKIKFDDHEPVIVGAVYNGDVSVIHEESDYRFYFVSRNMRRTEENLPLKDPPDWPLTKE